DGKGGQRPPQGQQAKRGNEPRPPSNERSDRGPKPRDDRRDDRRGGPRPSSPHGVANQTGDSLPREFREPGDPTRIPNPLQQTFDKRAIQSARVNPREDLYENGPIPNPLQQTYDKRFTQGQRGGGFGNPNQPRGGKGGDGPANPDPLQTAVGYIGADAFTRKSQGRGNNRGGRRGGGR
ncbi:MAG TPA: 23S rRNA pseudouridylate synthase B, partial [Ideonella sp.]|nr:23S rRNA pseudouridylate synthase B [Ideonella sp.]